MRKIILSTIFFILFIGSSSLASPTLESFSTTFNNSTGLTITGSTVTVPFYYPWNADDDGSNNKCKMVGDGDFCIQWGSKATQADIQVAQVLVKFPNGLGNHATLIVQADDYTATDINSYMLFFGRDIRCGVETNVYLSIEKSWGKGGSNQNALYDCQLIGTTPDPSTVYLMKMTSRFHKYSHMELIGQLYSVIGTTATLIATTKLNDYYGDADGDPIIGNESEFCILNDTGSKTYYVDNYSFSYKKDTMDYINVEYINLATKAANLIGYAFGCIKGDYLYLAPSYNSNYSDVHGNFVRYRINERIDDVNSWEVFDGNIDPLYARGFHGCVPADDNYIYYAPLWSDMTTLSGNVARYNTAVSFTSASSWEVVDISAFPGRSAWKGFVGNVSEGRYVDFVPYGSTPGQAHGKTARFDTTGTFTDVNSWKFFDLTTITHHTPPIVSADLIGYHLGCYDGSRYVYYAPFATGICNSHGDVDCNGNVVRYDTTGLFTDQNSWDAFNLKTIYDGHAGFYGCSKAGNYVYFVGNVNDIIAMYDTTGTFTSSSSWLFYSDIGYGFSGVASDSLFYAYFAPDFMVYDYYMHGRVRRLGLYPNPPFTPTYVTEYMNIASKDSHLVGHHGVNYDNNKLFFINIHQDGSTASGWVSRYNLGSNPTLGRSSASSF